jgi:hypothetical protein
MANNFAKRHYETIATAIQESIQGCNSSEQVAAVWRTANELARAFQNDNHLFNRERFLRACEPGANVRAKKAVHEHIGVGHCPVCNHYGRDCTGKKKAG